MKEILLVDRPKRKDKMHCCMKPLFDEEAGYQLFQNDEPLDEIPENIHLYNVFGNTFRLTESYSLFIALCFNRLLLMSILINGILLINYENYAINGTLLVISSILFLITIKSFFDSI